MNVKNIRDAISVITLATHNPGAGGVNGFKSTEGNTHSMRRAYQWALRSLHANGTIYHDIK